MAGRIVTHVEYLFVVHGDRYQKCRDDTRREYNFDKRKSADTPGDFWAERTYNILKKFVHLIHHTISQSQMDVAPVPLMVIVAVMVGRDLGRT
jgi:hypothetical protein